MNAPEQHVKTHNREDAPMSDLVPTLTTLAERINHEHQQAEPALRAGPGRKEKGAQR